MRKIFAGTCIAVLLCGVSGANARGRATFMHYCAPCHAPGMEHPGTMRLALRTGEADGALAARDDLAADYVIAIVRSGLGLMPAFRPSEIDDAALRALAAYLSRDGSAQ